MENKELTLGQKRVHLTFNPSNDNVIGQIKLKCAELIDLCNNHMIKPGDGKATHPEAGEANRCLATAMTNFETGQMYAVKGVAKLLPKKESTWQDRLIAERDELESKLNKLKDFLGGPDLLAYETNELLKEQAIAMNQYLNVLNTRIENL
jgi:hypothetical protein